MRGEGRSRNMSAMGVVTLGAVTLALRAHHNDENARPECTNSNVMQDSLHFMQM